MLKFTLHNLVSQLPYFGPRSFLKDAKKIIPGLEADDLLPAEGFGGVRPQLLDKKKMKMAFGEAKIMGARACLLTISSRNSFALVVGVHLSVFIQ